MGDAVGCAMAGQKLPDGYYKLDRMLTAIVRRGGEIGCCGTCMDARRITDGMHTEAPDDPPSTNSLTGPSPPTRSSPSELASARIARGRVHTATR